MERFCEHNAEWEDESLLLDDDNTNIRSCIKCKNKINGNVNSNWVQNMAEDLVIRNGIRNYEDHLDSPDDSPLLGTTPILATNLFHCHWTDKMQDDRKSLTKLEIAAFLCFLFMIAELIGGYIAGSLAIMTDAAHLFADLISFLVSILSLKLGKWPATRSMTFGYARAEVLGALLSVLAVWMLAGVFLVLAINRLWRDEYEINANTMIIIASLGLVVNILMGAVLHGVCHSHSNTTTLMHPHSHVENINVRAAAAHVLGDLFQSIGVLSAAIVIKIYPNMKQADPICTILFTVLVVFVTRNVVKDSVIILLEASPRNVTEILNAFQCIQGVKHVHSLHVWSLAPGRNVLSTHLAIDDNCDRDDILNQAALVAREKFNIISCTIQTEAYHEAFINDCDTCQVLYNGDKYII